MKFYPTPMLHSEILPQTSKNLHRLICHICDISQLCNTPSQCRTRRTTKFPATWTATGTATTRPIETSPPTTMENTPPTIRAKAKNTQILPKSPSRNLTLSPIQKILRLIQQSHRQQSHRRCILHSSRRRRLDRPCRSRPLTNIQYTMYNIYKIYTQ